MARSVLDVGDPNRAELDAPPNDDRAFYVLRSFVSGPSQMHSQILEASPGGPTYLNSCHYLTPPRHPWSTLAELDYPRRRPEAADAREPGCAPHGASVGQDVRTDVWQLLLSLLRKDRGPGPVHRVSRT